MRLLAAERIDLMLLDLGLPDLGGTEGIREEDLPHLFERFYTTRGKSADAARGVGLGLSICDAIARAHGGSIMAQSRESGGAVFTFELPMEEEER